MFSYYYQYVSIQTLLLGAYHCSTGIKLVTGEYYLLPTNTGDRLTFVTSKDNNIRRILHL